MLRIYIYRVISVFWTLFIVIFRKIKDDEKNNSKIAKRFLRYNNTITLKRLKHKTLNFQDILLLLPHCLQEYDCPIKITSNIDNCKRCGQCKIKAILDLKETYGISVKVATGGTLARKYIKDIRPKVVIAVACERDLISGIIDAFPLPVYGIFNERIHGPCFNTSVAIEEIKKILITLLHEQNQRTPTISALVS